MRKITLSVIAMAAIVAGAPAMADEQKASASSSAAAPAAPSAAKYNSTETTVGTLLDDPAAKAIIEKHIPGFTTSDQVDLARAMTLKQVQQYAPDDVTDEKLAAIDADLAKLK